MKRILNIISIIMLVIPSWVFAQITNKQIIQEINSLPAETNKLTYERTLKEFAFIVGIRPGYGMETVEKKIEDLKKRFGADINVINLPAPDVSSTEIREAISEKKDLCGLVPERVNEYIKANRLYQ